MGGIDVTTTNSSLQSCAVSYPTEGEILLFIRLKYREENVIGNFLFGFFLREEHEDVIKQIKKVCHIYFKAV